MKSWGIMAALAACWLVSCAQDAGFRAADDDKDAASQAYYGCLRDAADRADDGKSPLDAVIARVQTQCDNQYIALKAAFVKNLGGDGRLHFEADMDANRADTVRSVVLHRRQTRAARS